MRFRGVLIVFCAAMLACGAARAEIKTVFEKGAWETSAGTAEDGSRVCMVSTYGPDKAFHVKYFEGSTNFVTHLFKESWEIPEGVTAKIAIEFDKKGPWSGEAVSIGSGGLSGLELVFDMEQFPLFSDELKAAREMTVTFLEGNEGTWTADMNGSSASMSKMAECMKAFPPPSSSQPFDPAPSQPFDPEASQPFSTNPASPQDERKRIKTPIDPNSRSA